MKVREFAKSLLLGSTLEEKLISFRDLKIQTEILGPGEDIPLSPSRGNKISFSEKQIKFPKKGAFHDNSKKALAFHFFANHELLAIEMMAAALLYFPFETAEDLKMQAGLLGTIQDEQKHFLLYTHKMKEWGVEFGDYPVNDYFWRQFSKVKTPSEFYSLVALTFEQANLDFAGYYEHLFLELGDPDSARIMNIVYEDEINHVKIGQNLLNQWRGDSTLWDYFVQNLPDKVTPARAKGISFDKESRVRAGLSEEFIKNVKEYRDDFNITDRKEW